MRTRGILHDDRRLTSADRPPVAPDDIELFEMANLSAEQTGVDGVIYISTAQGRHAPRVKWYPGRPSANGPCLSVTIERQPQAFNHHLPERTFDAASDRVRRWVSLNDAALLEFWNVGHTWMDEEVSVFKNKLRKLD